MRLISRTAGPRSTPSLWSIAQGKLSIPQDHSLANDPAAARDDRDGGDVGAARLKPPPVDRQLVGAASRCGARYQRCRFTRARLRDRRYRKRMRPPGGRSGTRNFFLAPQVFVIASAAR
jgi:hypothetical protein